MFIENSSREIDQTPAEFSARWLPSAPQVASATASQRIPKPMIL